ncbi:hypothetical protein EDC30_1253 [Paucimonas lemoignei]|uniref:Uncharacterized protein n=1 Tax=Paucimonas lemoignei TaxID=29443 RepID=A0A4R3HPX4_PAULE|nr:hypothetical protein [Paucimonas lemoignei]TCS32065.1 hypothetical protein EDC30_1253 [Paucimonas lemoignei]
MSQIEGRSFFGYAAKCNDLKEVVALLRDITGEEATKATVAFGMLLAANSTDGGEYRDDALAVLNSLAYAKAELDIAGCHTFPTIEVTSDVLFSAQRYADENTIPCTEWPTSDEVINNVLETAKKYSKVTEWKRLIKNENGVVVGVESIENI